MPGSRASRSVRRKSARLPHWGGLVVLVRTALAEIHSGLVSVTLIADAAEATTRLISGPMVGRPLRSRTKSLNPL